MKLVKYFTLWTSLFIFPVTSSATDIITILEQAIQGAHRSKRDIIIFWFAARYASTGNSAWPRLVY